MSLPAFGVRNPVPANLLMVAALVIGVYSALTMRREFFPEVESQAAYIIAEYPGATPEEIEESIVYKLEDSLVGIDEIKQPCGPFPARVFNYSKVHGRIPVDSEDWGYRASGPPHSGVRPLPYKQEQRLHHTAPPPSGERVPPLGGGVDRWFLQCPPVKSAHTQRRRSVSKEARL